ncbi:MAG: IreB family regulatory phosphoprotein [Bacilli bacterium]
MDNNTTVLFNVSEVNEKLIKDTLRDALESLEERGYNPINQLVGYIISGDLGYISSYKETRNKIAKIDRTVLVEVLLKNYLK